MVGGHDPAGRRRPIAGPCRGGEAERDHRVAAAGASERELRATQPVGDPQHGQALARRHARDARLPVVGVVALTGVDDMRGGDHEAVAGVEHPAAAEPSAYAVAARLDLEGGRRGRADRVGDPLFLRAAGGQDDGERDQRHGGRGEQEATSPPRARPQPPGERPRRAFRLDHDPRLPGARRGAGDRRIGTQHGDPHVADPHLLAAAEQRVLDARAIHERPVHGAEVVQPHTVALRRQRGVTAGGASVADDQAGALDPAQHERARDLDDATGVLAGEHLEPHRVARGRACRRSWRPHAGRGPARSCAARARPRRWVRCALACRVASRATTAAVRAEHGSMTRPSLHANA